MSEKLSFRRATTGEWEDVDVTRVGEVAIPAGAYLRGQELELPDGTQLREHRVASRVHRGEGYSRIDNEILAGRRLHELARGSGYPPELACLYGDYDDKVPVADPFTLFEPYRGEPLRTVVRRLFPAQQEAVQTGLLTALCWLASAGLAHRCLNPDTVLWDGERVQLTAFSEATVFGASRTPISGRLDWVAREQRPGEAYGTVGPGDDVWAAGRLIFYVRTEGEELHNRAQLTQLGLDQLLHGVFGEPEQRPAASELLERMGLRDTVPRLPEDVRIREGRRRFLTVRGRKHPGAALPRDLAERLADPDRKAGPEGRAPQGSADSPAVPPTMPVPPTPNGAVADPEVPAQAGDATRETGRSWGRRKRGGR
jgi:serine/threonine protein kinase